MRVVPARVVGSRSRPRDTFSIANPQGRVLRVLKILGLHETLTAGA
ncbi:hypothetical protein Pme01_23950 [Planosporangium mesophilum]|uniref:Uncharacterized protein n=1 Tax=Planosporangium mesophilum TaxID=689768 RepID=A0A8J3T9P7_9ACTN|nr:hypothetical protein Pme01_23950 [Planosporangium mesophilum]